MATIQASPVAKPASSSEFNRVQIRKWASMTTGDVGEPVSLCNHADRSIKVGGDFGSGATVTIQGYIGEFDAVSLADDANWLTLTDQSDNNLEFTEAKIECIAQVVTHIRPVITGGTSPSINVYLVVKE